VREDGIISLQQLTALIIVYLIGRSTLVFPVGPAAQDVWLTIILGALLASLVMLLWISMGLRFEGIDPIVYTRVTLGNVLGTLLTALYMLFFLQVAAGVLRNICELYVTSVMKATPIVVFAGVTAFLAALAARAGLENIARLAELILPWLISGMLLLTVLVLATPGLPHPEYLLPVFGSGWINILRSTIIHFTFPFMEANVLVFALPFLDFPRGCKKSIYVGVAIVTLILALTNIRNLMVLGPQGISRVNFPFLTTIQLVDIGEFLQRLDPIAIFIWTLGTFVKLSLLVYVISIGWASLFALADYRPLVFPVSILMATISIILYESYAQMKDFYLTTYPFYGLPFQVLGPLLVLTIAKIRGLTSDDIYRGRKKKPEN
jgi:spore germination protein KB